MSDPIDPSDESHLLPRDNRYTTGRRVVAYPDEVWESIRQSIVTNDGLSNRELSLKHGIPEAAIATKASRKGWLAQRQRYKSIGNSAFLERVVQELGHQTTDIFQLCAAAVEALQYSYQIKIMRDNNNNLHFRNFEGFIEKPEEWKNLTEQERESMRRFIDPKRLNRFLDSLLNIIQTRFSALQFVAKVIKGSLPKIDPISLDLSRREGDDQLVELQPTALILLAQAENDKVRANKSKGPANSDDKVNKLSKTKIIEFSPRIKTKPESVSLEEDDVDDVDDLDDDTDGDNDDESDF